MKQTTTTSKKQVRETNAGKSISAWVILRNDGRHVGTVQAVFLDSGNVMVDVWGPHSLEYQGKAGGYGYDKLTAALAGAKIDGHLLWDHSVGSYKGGDSVFTELNKLYQRYERNHNNGADWQAEAAKIGASFANWNEGKYDSLYWISGLDRLSALGYRVIQAI